MHFNIFCKYFCFCFIHIQYHILITNILFLILLLYFFPFMCYPQYLCHFASVTAELLFYSVHVACLALLGGRLQTHIRDKGSLVSSDPVYNIPDWKFCSDNNLMNASGGPMGTPSRSTNPADDPALSREVSERPCSGDKTKRAETKRRALNPARLCCDL